VQQRQRQQQQKGLGNYSFKGAGRRHRSTLAVHRPEAAAVVGVVRHPAWVDSERRRPHSAVAVDSVVGLRGPGLDSAIPQRLPDQTYSAVDQVDLVVLLEDSEMETDSDRQPQQRATAIRMVDSTPMALPVSIKAVVVLELHMADNRNSSSSSSMGNKRHRDNTTILVPCAD